MKHRLHGAFRERAIVAALALVMSVADSRAVSSVSLSLDNDFLYSPRNDDWNYTGGISIEHAGPEVEQLRLTAPTRQLDDVLFGWSGVQKKFPHERHSLIVGGTSYTPHDITSEETIPDDRPYASLTFLAGRIRRMDDDRAPTRGLTTEFSIGVLGLGLAEEVQARLHSAAPGDDHDIPRGWEHQISDGGELTVEYRAAVDMLVLREASSARSDWFQAVAGAELAAGYNTYGWAGGLLKIGRMGKDYGAPGSIIGPLAGCATDAGGSSAGFVRECYLFTRAGGYAVAYNALLEGQFRRSEVTIPASRVERFVDEFQYGLVLRVARVSFVYALTRRSAEFDGDLANAQYFGTATLMWSWNF